MARTILMSKKQCSRWTFSCHIVTSFGAFISISPKYFFHSFAFSKEIFKSKRGRNEWIFPFVGHISIFCEKISDILSFFFLFYCWTVTVTEMSQWFCCKFRTNLLLFFLVVKNIGNLNEQMSGCIWMWTPPTTITSFIIRIVLFHLIYNSNWSHMHFSPLQKRFVIWSVKMSAIYVDHLNIWPLHGSVDEKQFNGLCSVFNEPIF